jgi:LCP family protein required for cell wall assembly
LSSQLPGPAGDQPADKRVPNRRRRWPRRAAAVVLALVLLAAAGAGAAVEYVHYRFGQVRKIRVPGLVTPAARAKTNRAKTSLTILLVGSNTRTGLKPGEAGAFGTPGEVGGARSDVTMLLHLDPATGSASLLSIPRDLFVPLPAHSVSGPVGKIDAALNDGPEQLVEAITNDLGIPIDHYVEVNFDGFQNVIDALGGIDMDFPTPVHDRESSLNITVTGCQHLNGFQALAVVRARHLSYYANGSWHADPLSDLSRIRRDHEFLKVFVDTMKAKGLNDPLRANAVLGNLVHQVTIDTGFSLNEMLDLLRRYRSINVNAVPTVTLPVSVVNNYRWRGVSYGDVVMPSEPEDHQLVDGWLGQPLPAARAGSFPVTVRDTSGVRGKGYAVARQLMALGFSVTGFQYSYPPAAPAETLVRYGAGALAQARAVRAVLHGVVMMQADGSVPAGAVAVDVGSVLTVTAPPASPLARVTSPSTITGPAPVTIATTTTTTPTPGGQALSPAQNPLQPFDPTGCGVGR